MIHYLKNEEKNGIEIYFSNKPEEAILSKLKEGKWRWHRTKMCWYNRYSPENEDLAKRLCNGNKEENLPKLEPKKVEKKVHTQATSKLRIKDSMIVRDDSLDSTFGITDVKLYGYAHDEEICIVGEVFAKEPLKKDFCFICNLYDHDDDIIESSENDSYGSGLVTSMIRRNSFFDGFPFMFRFMSRSISDVKYIKITPAVSY